jgi:hypothetical protein
MVEKKKPFAKLAKSLPPSATLYKNASRDILKDKYIEEVKKRVMRDLFS